MTTMVLSEVNEYGYFTGATYETPTYSAIPQGWTDVLLPEIPEGKYAVLRNFNWVIVDSLPEISGPDPVVIPEGTPPEVL